MTATPAHNTALRLAGGDGQRDDARLFGWQFAWLRQHVFAGEGARWTGAEWAVLAAMLAHADRYGEAWPSLDLIARLTGLSRRSVQYALRTLTAMGLLTRESGTRRTDTYRFSMPDTEQARGIPTPGHAHTTDAGIRAESHRGIPAGRVGVASPDISTDPADRPGRGAAQCTGGVQKTTRGGAAQCTQTLKNELFVVELRNARSDDDEGFSQTADADPDLADVDASGSGARGVSMFAFHEAMRGLVDQCGFRVRDARRLVEQHGVSQVEESLAKAIFLQQRGEIRSSLRGFLVTDLEKGVGPDPRMETQREREEARRRAEAARIETEEQERRKQTAADQDAAVGELLMATLPESSVAAAFARVLAAQPPAVRARLSRLNPTHRSVRAMVSDELMRTQGK